MGLMDSIVGAIRETNENAHGARLKSDVFKTLEILHNAGPEVETEGLILFQQLHQDVVAKCKSWSRDGHLKIANQFQNEARKHKDFELGKACGYYLASAFLEAKVRDSLDAKLTFMHLEVVATEIAKQFKAESLRVSSSHDGTAIFKLCDTCMTGILIAAFWPPQGEKTTKDFEPRIKALPTEGMHLVICVAFGLIDGLAQKAGIGQTETLACITTFLISQFKFSDDLAALALRNLMRRSGDESSQEYAYIRLGGDAAVAICAEPDNLTPLSDCGWQVRELLDKINY